jgi:hypothetical protein
MLMITSTRDRYQDQKRTNAGPVGAHANRLS